MSMLVSALVDEVVDAFRAAVRQQEPTTSLDGSMTDSATSFTVTDASTMGKGLTQIEDEMVFVKSVDRNTNTVELEPWGRAQSGSTAAAHSSGARVTQAPVVPRVRARDLIAQVLQEVFPRLFAVSSTTLDISAAVSNYDLPANCYHVLSVQYQLPGPSGEWIPVRRWRQNKTDTALELEILQYVQPGNDTVRVFYIKNPPTTIAMSDDLETLGFPTSIRDLIVLGACSHLATWAEAGRIQTNSVESHARSEAVPAGSGLALSRFLYQKFVARVEDEARNLSLRHPISSHFTR